MKLSLSPVVEVPYQSADTGFAVVLGKVLGVVSFDAVYGKVLDIGLISDRFLAS